MIGTTQILTTEQMRRVEFDAIESGEVTGLSLMERAGRAVADQIRLHWPKPGRVLVLCGPGNNGGDGYVIARMLSQAGWHVRVLGLDNMPGPDAAEMKRRWRKIGGIGALTADGFRSGGDFDVYVDAIFGIGVSRAPTGDLNDILGYLGGSGSDWGFFRERIVSVDCPSGLCLDSGFFLGKSRAPDEFDLHARLTVTFDSPKIGHLLGRGPDCCGKLVVADIGLQRWRERTWRDTSPRPVYACAIWPVQDGVNDRDAGIWSRNRLSKHGTLSPHKYHHGHALVVAGSSGMGGAARLSARAALRVGAGLVTIAPTRDALPEHCGQPDALMRKAVDSAEELQDLLADTRINAVCIGPGCGVDRAGRLLAEVLATRRATLLDADALTALSRDADLMTALHPTCILTPHEGEFARLFPDIADRLNGPKSPMLRYQDALDPNWVAGLKAKLENYSTALESNDRRPYSKLDAARDAAGSCGAVVLLKGPDTVIASPEGTAIIHSAFDVPWLATAGAGDVLSGLITGLLARGFQPLEAASLGTLLHAKAARRFGPGLIADDLPDIIPQVFRDLAL